MISGHKSYFWINILLKKAYLGFVTKKLKNDVRNYACKDKNNFLVSLSLMCFYFMSITLHLLLKI